MAGLRNLGVSGWALPVAGETYDGTMNDINGFHIKPHHLFAAIDQARDGPIDEGSVGGGTGMICYGFKGGSGHGFSRLNACQYRRHAGRFCSS